MRVRFVRTSLWLYVSLGLSSARLSRGEVEIFSRLARERERERESERENYCTARDLSLIINTPTRRGGNF